MVQPHGWTKDVLPDRFSGLNRGYFSLSQEAEYYKNIRINLSPRPNFRKMPLDTPLAERPEIPASRPSAAWLAITNLRMYVRGIDGLRIRNAASTVGTWDQ